MEKYINRFPNGELRDDAEYMIAISQIETNDFSPRDLTILRAHEWNRINFTDPAKRALTAKRMNIIKVELLEIRQRTRAKA